LFRCFEAHRQSPSFLAFLQSMPEVRSLPSAGITRPPRSYGPVRLPSGRHQMWRSGWRTPPDRASPDNPHCLASVLCPLPRRTETGALAGFLPRSARPSPLPRRVSIRITTFEACSGFNILRPTGSLSRPRRPSSQGSGPLLSRPPVSYSIKPATIEVEPSSTGNTRLRGALGKGGGTTSPLEIAIVRRAHAVLPVTRGHGAREGFFFAGPCQRLCPPYKTVPPDGQ